MELRIIEQKICLDSDQMDAHKGKPMRTFTRIFFIVAIMFVGGIVGSAVRPVPSRPSVALNQCTCSIKSEGDAMCFFDGVTCPRTGGKCTCAN